MVSKQVFNSCSPYLLVRIDFVICNPWRFGKPQHFVVSGATWPLGVFQLGSLLNPSQKLLGSSHHFAMSNQVMGCGLRYLCSSSVECGLDRKACSKQASTGARQKARNNDCIMAGKQSTNCQNMGHFACYDSYQLASGEAAR